MSLQLSPTPWEPLHWSPPDSSVHGILQGRILEWVAIPSSRGSSWTKDWTRVSCSSCTAGGFFTAEPKGKPHVLLREYQKWWKLFIEAGFPDLPRKWKIIIHLIFVSFKKLLHGKYECSRLATITFQIFLRESNLFLVSGTTVTHQSLDLALDPNERSLWYKENYLYVSYFLCWD